MEYIVETKNVDDLLRSDSLLHNVEVAKANELELVNVYSEPYFPPTLFGSIRRSLFYLGVGQPDHWNVTHQFQFIPKDKHDAQRQDGD